MPDNQDSPFKKNALFIAGGVGYLILGLLGCIFLTESTAADLADLAVSTDFSDPPKPCGYAVPSLAILMTDLNFEPYPTVSGFRGTDASHVDAALRGICRLDSAAAPPTTVSGSVARLWNQVHGAVDDPYEFKKEACGRTYVREVVWHSLSGPNLQDPMSRIRRAYVRAQPAFARYQQHLDENGNTGDPDCNWDLNPFQDDAGGTCNTDDAHAAIQAELAAGASQDLVCGAKDAVAPTAGSGTGKLPSYDQMVFRLVALAVVAESDRATNGARCFQNLLREQTATEMCEALNMPACGNSWSAPTNLLYPWEQHTHPDSAEEWACNTEAKSEDLTDLYPSEPRFPRYVLEERNKPNSEAATEHCVRVLEYNSRTSEFLFGLPDVDRAPDPHPVGLAGDAGAALVNITYLPWFLDGREAEYSELKSSALRDGLAYEGFRFGFALFLRIPALYAAAFWAGRGAILCVGSVVPALRNLLTNTSVDEVEKPSGWTLTTVLAVVVGLLSALLARIIDPLAVPESSKTTCTEYASTGRVYDSNQLDAVRDYVASIFIFLVSGFAVVWELALRRPKKIGAGTKTQKEMLQDVLRSERGLSGVLLLLFLFLILLECIFCGDLAIKSGHDLQLYIYDAEATSAAKPLRVLEGDVYFLQAVVISHAAVIGAFTTMFAFATALGNLRLLPLFLWLGTILVTLLVGYTRFGHYNANTPDDGTRGFTTALTVVVDVALGAYACIVAYLRRKKVKGLIDQQNRERNEEQRANYKAARAEKRAAAPARQFARRAQGWYNNWRGARGAAAAKTTKSSASMIGGGTEQLPLIALGVQR